MMKWKILGATALLAATAMSATPSMAQTMRDINPSYCAQFGATGYCPPPANGYYNSSYYGPGHEGSIAYQSSGDIGWNPHGYYARQGWRHYGWNDAYNGGYYDGGYYARRDGFWPGEVAGDIVGGAVNTAGAVVGAAGAVATAPFRTTSGDTYASMDMPANDSACAQRYKSYDPASGTYLGYDGQRHACRL